MSLNRTETRMTEPASKQPQPSQNKSRQLVWRLASVLVTAGLLFFLIRVLEGVDFGELLGRISFSHLSAALLAYLALNVFRAIRFRVLLDKDDAPLRILFPITLYHNGLVRVLPFKLGELSYIVLLRSRLNYSMEEGVSSLFGARILELLIIVIVFASGILLSGGQFVAQRDSLLPAIVLIFIISALGLYFAGGLIRFMLGIFQRLLAVFIQREIGLIAAMQSKLLELAQEFDRIRHPRLFVSALFITCFTYTSSFMTNYILLRSVGMDIELPIMVAMISFGMFGAALPLPALGGFGLVEGVWLIALTQFAAYPQSEAAAIGFILHGFQVIAAILYGFAGYVMIHLSPPLPSSAVMMPPEVIQQQEEIS